MNIFNMETLESEDASASNRSRAVGFLRRRTRDGTIPLLAGATVFVRTLRARGNQNHTTGRSLVAASLIGIGIWQRRQRRATSTGEHDVEHYTGSGTFDQRADSHQKDTNPRDTASEPDVETKTDPEEGSIQFTDEQKDGPQSNSDIDDTSGDPRIDDEDVTEVDISQASMADEASEAAGPSSVQSQPTQSDNTEPEETPEEDAPYPESEDTKADESDPDDQESH